MEEERRRVRKEQDKNRKTNRYVIKERAEKDREVEGRGIGSQRGM
jgi:hypothetical protein